MLFLSLLLVACMFGLSSCQTVGFGDCTLSFGTSGNYRVGRFNTTDQEGVELFGLMPRESVPNGVPGFPVLAYAHGLTGDWSQSERQLMMIASWGFVVVFPHIKGPEEDTRPTTTDPMGGFLLKAVEYINIAAEDEGSELYGRVDVNNIVLGGHSMGASTAIMAAAKLQEAGTAGAIKFVFSLHPGLCGPIGPPPCLQHGGPLCSTWLDIDVDLLLQSTPFLLTTATNDGAFRPAPNTAAEELACFTGGMNLSSTTSTDAVFAQFTEESCLGGLGEENGHCCPLGDDWEYTLTGSNPDPQWPWVIRAMRLYAQQGGNLNTECADLYLGNGGQSLSESRDIERSVFRVLQYPPAGF